MDICSPPRPAAAPPLHQHPLGTRANVLLSSVFGPYAQDDEYGSRAINPMELWHNQVTRVQGVFSLRMFHRSWGLMLIQANMDAPCTCLDFPTMDRFVREISENRYDVIGLSAIRPNFLKIKKMCELIRLHSPQSIIVIGGHIANMPDLSDRVDADHVVRGDGVRWFRRYLGQREDAPIRHPVTWAGLRTRAMGLNLRLGPRHSSAALIPSVGCPIGCNFCSTSAMFGGKGKCVKFYETGDELFDVMSQLEKAMKVKSFFVMDENFLLDRKRALRLLELMQAHNKSWALYVFSSANAILSYTMEQLVALGISWVWMGLEGENSRYGKLRDTDTRELVRQMQSHGIRVLGSTIIGLEEHTPQNIDEAIDYAVSHDTDFHQFMLYTPVPGTPLHAELEAKGELLGPDEITEADVHGQFRFCHRHRHIPAGQETDFLLRAFQRDFDVNGPSILRVVTTKLAGWKRYRNHPDARIRARFVWEIEEVDLGLLGTLWAGRRWFKDNPAVSARLERDYKEARKLLGWKAWILAPLVGRLVLWLARREQKRLARGWTTEPQTFYEKNLAAGDASDPRRPAVSVLQSVVPASPPGSRSHSEPGWRKSRRRQPAEVPVG